MNKTATATAFVMNTTVTATVYGADEVSAEKVLDVARKCEEQLKDKTFTDGEIRTELNGIKEDTDGLFDIDIGALTKLWGIGTENARVPSQEEIEDALDDRSVTDPGSFGKGYACDMIREYLDSEGIPGACVAVGGSVLCYGNKDGVKGEPTKYTIAVRDPDGDVNDYVATVEVADAVISTSGDYEHEFEADGKRYHHILSPKTGYPADSGLKSVTVICKSGLLSDALSTAAFSVGKDEGMRLLKKYGAEGIFIDKDNNILTTDGVKITQRKGSR